MALENFWKNINVSANWFGLGIESSPDADRDEIEENLRGATYWLRPGLVGGYNPEEFDFLSQEERSRLHEGVEKFKRAAESVPRRKRATVEEYREGEAALREILEVLQPDKYRDFDAFVIGKKIERMVRDELPSWVTEITFETGLDSTGDLALRINVVAEDYSLTDEVLRKNSRKVQDLLSEAASEITPERFPYFHFRTVSESERMTRADRI